MKKIHIIETFDTNPYHNLALEEALLKSVKPEECILYLWQNRQTVVIGRNQNALAECKVQKLEADGGFLARRLSGGGAVFHDLGNLNFTFLACADWFSKEIQTDIIIDAIRSLGIDAEKNGRNDLTVNGQKFSGHAYYKTKDKCYHHGTIMLDVDKNMLSQYLNVSELKLKSKGVKSVRSRVINLRDIKPKLEIDDIKKELINSFSRIYKLPVCVIDENSVDKELLSELEKRYSSKQWKYAGEKILSNSIEKRFDWGQSRLDYEIENNKFTAVRFYSDGLEADFLSTVAEKLHGCSLENDDLISKLSENCEQTEQIIQMICDIVKMISEIKRG